MMPMIRYVTNEKYSNILSLVYKSRGINLLTRSDNTYNMRLIYTCMLGCCIMAGCTVRDVMYISVVYAYIIVRVSYICLYRVSFDFFFFFFDTD